MRALSLNMDTDEFLNRCHKGFKVLASYSEKTYGQDPDRQSPPSSVNPTVPEALIARTYVEARG